MKILSVDTSSNICNINLSENGKNIMYLELDEDITHAKKLLEGIDKILKETNTKLKDIDFFGSILGPGSFTGIRIGIATIKGFALAMNKNVISASSLELLKENALEEIKESEGNNSIIVSIIDARNEEVYASISSTNEIHKEEKLFAGNIYDFINFLRKEINIEKEKTTEINNEIKIYIVGSGKDLFKEKIEEIENKKDKEKNNFKIIYIKDEKQRAKHMGRLIYNKRNNNISGEKIMPIYLKNASIKKKNPKKV